MARVVRCHGWLLSLPLLLALAASVAVAAALSSRNPHHRHGPRSGFIITALRPPRAGLQSLKQHSLSAATPQPRTAALALHPTDHQTQQQCRRSTMVSTLLRRRGGVFHLEPAVVKASLTAVAELLISCGIGAYATRKGVLDRTVVSSLSKYVRGCVSVCCVSVG